VPIGEEQKMLAVVVSKELYQIIAREARARDQSISGYGRYLVKRGLGLEGAVV